MNLSLYQDHCTWLHRLDPRTKLAGVVSIFVLCLCFNHPLYMAIVTGTTLALVFISRVQRALWPLRYLILLLVLFSTILWPFFVQGPTLIFRWNFLEISRESLLYGIAMGLRLATFTLGGVLFLATTRNEEISSGLARLGLPYALVFALSTALRLVPTFVGAGATIVQAQVSRGLDLESKSLVARFSAFIPLAVPMFIAAIRYTNLLSMALESRGFRPGAPRSFFYEPRLEPKDWRVLICLTCMLMLALFVRLGMGWGAIISGRL